MSTTHRLLLATCFLLLSRPLHAETIYVVDHGWHTGIVIPAESVNQQIPFLLDRFYEASWYEFGWGDDGFYQADEITAGLALNALFDSQASVVHVVALRRPPSEFFFNSDVIGFELDAQQTGRLVGFIARAFVLEEQRPVLLKLGLYADSHFFRSDIPYTLMYTCNRWTADALASTGMGLDNRSVFLSSQVMRRLRGLVSETE